MSSAMMMDRTGQGIAGVANPTTNYSNQGVTGMPGAGNWMMVPRCGFKVEKVQGGMKVTCVCDDKTACSMVQNLCTMLTGGMASCCVMLNGMTVAAYNFTMGACKCEPTDTGVCFTCTSGDAQWSQMIQACCDNLAVLVESGCTCCFLINNTPVCCGVSETAKNAAKAKTGK
jgi:hypothetical protein